jgi:NADPH-dependent 2,4-dienoyl-CoA reductase/sulfur reductase-like enzyme
MMAWLCFAIGAALVFCCALALWRRRGDHRRRRAELVVVRRVLVIGAGAVGCFLAARLRQAGHDVSVLARGRRLAQLRASAGHLRLRDWKTDARFESTLPVIDSVPAAQDQQYDLVLVVVKAN